MFQLKEVNLKGFEHVKATRFNRLTIARLQKRGPAPAGKVSLIFLGEASY